MTLGWILRWSLRVIAAGVLGLLAVLVINTLAVRALDEPPPAAALIPVDTAAVSDRLARAIRIDTRSKAPGEPVNPEAFREFHAFLKQSYPSAHKVMEREVVNDFSLIYHWPGTDPSAQPILLTAHQDVVPKNGEWSKPAFAGLIEDGFIWGRGSLDDKVSVLGLLEAIEKLIADGFKPNRSVYLAFGHDEEIDGRNGAKAIAKLFADRGLRFAFLLDEGSPIGEGLVPLVDAPVALVGMAEKGYLSVELDARTTGGHSSIPSDASAMRAMFQAMLELYDIADKGTLRPPFTDTLEAMQPHVDFLPRMVLANRWLFDPILIELLTGYPEAQAMIRTTGTTTIVRAGETDNVMPSSAKAVVNFRLLPGVTVDAHIAAIGRAITDERVSASAIGEPSDPSPISDVDSEAYALLSMSIRQVFRDAIVMPTLVIAATDSRHYAGVTDQIFRFLPTRLGPDDLDRMHGIDERITIENYAEIIRFYARLIQNAASG